MLGECQTELLESKQIHMAKCPVCFHTLDSHILSRLSENMNRIPLDCRGTLYVPGAHYCSCEYYYDCIEEEDDGRQERK